MSRIKKHINIPIFIPEAACPFQCIYCNQRKITGKQELPADDQIIETIEDYLSGISEKTEVELAYFGGNFTGFPPDTQEHFLKLVKPYIEKNKIQSIRISTRPDYISEEILDILKKHHVRTIELGAQSMDDEVLLSSKRGHTAIQTEQASKMIIDHGFNLGLQMMIGLPGDSFEKSKFTAQKIIGLGAMETRIYPTLVIKGTKLESLFRKGLFKPINLDEAVDWSAQLLQLFENAKVKVLKLGLHPSEGLLSGEDLVAGPWHISFRELVLSKIWKEILIAIPKSIDQKLFIEVPKSQFNYAVGYAGSNKKLLEGRFKAVKFNTNDHLKGRDYLVKTL